MATAYGAAGEVAKEKAKRVFGLNMPPIITLVLLIATITFMILGWFNFENVALGLVSVVVAIFTVLGIFGKRFHAAFEKSYDKLLNSYKHAVSFFAAHKLTSFGIVGASIAILVWLMSITPSGMVPNEDTGTIFCMIDMPPGTSQERTGEVLDQVDA